MSFSSLGSWRRPVVQGLAVVLLLALGWPVAGIPRPAPAADVAQAQPRAPEAPPLTLGITTSADTISAGEMVTASFTLEHTGTIPISATLVMTLPTNITGVEAGIDQAQTSGVQTAHLKRGGGVVQWWGAMQPGGRLVVEMQLTSALCNNEVIGGMLLQGKAMAASFGGQVEASKQVAVQCLPLYDGNDISLETGIVGDGPGGTTTMTGTIAYAGQPVEMEIRFTPHVTIVTHALITAKLLPQGLGTCEWATGGAASDGERDVAILGSALTGEPDLGILLLNVAPEETRTIRLRGRATTDNLACGLAGSARAFAFPAGGGLVPPGARLAFLRQLQTLTPVESNEVTLRVAAPDLGDAPDSSNHFGVPMQAYPGVPAHFPTVFDPATGLAPGPLHLASPPFHLGWRSSREREADLGANRNLRPVLNQTDLDWYDDGLNPATVSFSACQTTNLEVRVTVAPKGRAFFEASGGTGYLNVWVDANRDGDWRDAVDCGAGVGQAAEHIVIDYPVDAKALGAGSHLLNVPTGLVPWPENDPHWPAWLRVTLSESPAPKGLSAGSLVYGSGRGPLPPYLLGETEDYLLRWPDTPAEWLAGPNVSAGVEGTIDRTMEVTAGRATTNRRLAKLSIRLANIGDAPAPNTTLTIDSSPYLGLPDLAAGTDGEGGEPDPFPCPPYCCLTCIVRSGVEPVVEFSKEVAVPHVVAPRTPGFPPFSEVCDGPDCHLEVFLGTLPANSRGRIILGWYLDDLDLSQTLSMTARFASDGDIYSPNDGGTYVFGPLYDQKLAITWPGGATTFDQMVALEGTAPPTATVQIVVDGTPASTVMADGQGHWTAVEALSQGAHLVRVVNQAGVGRQVDKSAPKLLFVNPDLPWDPASWSFFEGANQIQPRDPAGRSDTEGWIVTLRPDVTLSSTIRTQCPSPLTDVSLNFASIQVIYNDPELDGTYQAQFQVPSALARAQTPLAARLNMTCETDEFEYQGYVLIQAPGAVLDAGTMAPLAGASVGLLEEGLPWPGEAYGQPNPTLTGADGAYGLYPPPGTYQLYATQAGFQPYRSGPFEVQMGLDGRNISLVAEPAQRAGQPVPPPDVILGGAGFSSPILAVSPGSVVAWFNADLVYHSIVGDGWDSGLLAGGEGFQRQFTTPGIYGYHDGEDPLSQGLIFVDQAAARYAIYLPLVSK